MKKNSAQIVIDIELVELPQDPYIIDEQYNAALQREYMDCILYDVGRAVKDPLSLLKTWEITIVWPEPTHLAEYQAVVGGL